DALADDEVAAEPISHPDRRCAGRLVLADPEVRGEVAAAQRPGGLVLPGPDVATGAAHRPWHLGVHGRDRVELDDRERVDPGRPGADPAPIVGAPSADVARP